MEVIPAAHHQLHYTHSLSIDAARERHCNQVPKLRVCHLTARVAEDLEVLEEACMDGGMGKWTSI